MCAEATPVMAFVAPFFEGFISEWEHMKADPELGYLEGMLDAGIDKLKDQFAEYRFSKSAVMTIGWFIYPSISIYVLIFI